MSKGIAQMLLATGCFAIMNVLVKYCQRIPAMEIVFARALVSFVISFTIVKIKKIPIRGNRTGVLIMRGVFGTCALILYFYTLQQMPLASALVIHYLAPLFTSLIAFWVLGERLFKVQWLFFGICLAGVVLMKGFDHRVSTIDVIAGVGAAVLSGAAYNCIRYLKQTENANLIILYFPMVAFPITGILLTVSGMWVEPNLPEVGLLLAIGVLTQIAQYFLTRAFQTEEANKVSIVTYSGLIYGLIFGYFVFNEAFDLKQFAAIGLVMAGMLANVLFNRKKA
jgi:drug/metabolite transporter (DMT)-like permease